MAFGSDRCGVAGETVSNLRRRRCSTLALGPRPRVMVQRNGTPKVCFTRFGLIHAFSVRVGGPVTLGPRTLSFLHNFFDLFAGHN